MLISVIIPFYNVEQYVRRCLESVITQTYSKIEIICVDDGSTDKTAEILDYYEKKDERIIVIHKENGGLVSARKCGKHRATGDYIVDVDGDDWIENNRIQLLVDAIYRQKADVYYMSGLYRDMGAQCSLSDCYFREDSFFDKRQICDTFMAQIGDLSKTFGKMVFRNGCCWVARKDLARICQDAVDERTTMGEDAILVYNYLQWANSIFVFPNPTYHYVQHAQSMSHLDKNISDAKQFARSLLSVAPQNEYSKRLQELIVYYVIVNGALFDYKCGILYPYSRVKVGNSVAVYGCGSFGQRLVSEVLKSEQFSVKCWVDKNVRQSSIVNYEVEPIDKLKFVDFDYVVIAITDEDISREAEQYLYEIGIDKSKIARIDRNYMLTQEFNDIMCGC